PGRGCSVGRGTWFNNRGALTIVGDAKQGLTAAAPLPGVAPDRSALSAHRGAHPRIGALDVLPFVPLRDAGLAEAAALAHRAGAQIWRRYGIPSYFYGAAAKSPERS